MYRSFFFVCSFLFCVSSQVLSISQDSLKNLMVNGSPYDFLLIDVRNESELSSMIGNDICKPYNLPWPTQFQAECGKIGKEQVVIIYCASGRRAQSAADYLQSLEFKTVYTAGAISSWMGPTVTKSKALPVDSLPRPSMRGTITSITFKTPVRQNRTAVVKTYIPNTFTRLYVKRGQTLYNLIGREKWVK